MKSNPLEQNGPSGVLLIDKAPDMTSHDVVAIARDDWALTSERVDRIVSALRGQHGGLTDAEVLVPLRAAGAAAGMLR